MKTHGPRPHELFKHIQLDSGLPDEVINLMLEDQFVDSDRVLKQEWMNAILSEFGCRITQFEDVKDDTTTIVITKITETLPDEIDFDNYCYFKLVPCNKTTNECILFQKHPPYCKLF